MRLQLAPACLTLAIAFLAGCEGMAFHNAEMANTPESYEAFLAEFPDSNRYEDIQQRVEKLRFEAAMKDGSSAAIRDYLQLHPNGEHVNEALAAEDATSFEEAQAEGTIEAYQGYMDAHPKGKHLEQARGLQDRLKYLPRLSIEETTTRRINLANDPKGPLNGWEVLANIVNKGGRTLRIVELDIQVLDSRGEVYGDTHTWWAVSRELGGFPTPDAMKPPLPPEGTRVFRWTTGEVPEGWAEQLKLAVTDVVFEY